MFKEFKDFISKGNVMDLAVGVIIGAAFGKIVTSLVDDMIMPILGIILGKINFSNLKIVITPASGDTPEAAILYGSFIQTLSPDPLQQKYIHSSTAYKHHIPYTFQSNGYIRCFS